MTHSKSSYPVRHLCVICASMLLALLASPSVFSQCQNAAVNFYPAGTVSSVNITVGSAALAHVNSAISIWGECDDNWGINPSNDFPGFTVNQSPPSGPSWTIMWLPYSPEAGRCGQLFEDDHRIEIYESNPTVPNCNENGAWASVIAHELGHAIGITEQTNPSCSGNLMSQP